MMYYVELQHTVFLYYIYEYTQTVWVSMWAYLRCSQMKTLIFAITIYSNVSSRSNK